LISGEVPEVPVPRTTESAKVSYLKPLKNKHHLSRVAELGCMALNGACGQPAQIHHAWQSRYGRGDWYSIGLCEVHHTGTHGIHTIGRSKWEMLNGDQARLLERVLDRLYG